MITTVTMWTRDNTDYIEIYSEHADTIRLYDMEGTSYGIPLTYLRDFLYIFDRPEDANLDRFELFRNGVEIYAHLGDYSIERERLGEIREQRREVMPPPRPGIIPPGYDTIDFDVDRIPEIPTSDFQNREIKIGYYNLTTHFANWDSNTHPYFYTNLIPENYMSSTYDTGSIQTSRKVLRIITPDYTFYPGIMNPIEITRDAFDDMLSEPTELFDYEYIGYVHIDENNKYLIPFSNGTTAFYEEYDEEEIIEWDIYTQNTNATNATFMPMALTEFNEPQIIGYDSGSTTRADIEYRGTEVPGTFNRRFESRIETTVYNPIVGMGRRIISDPFGRRFTYEPTTEYSLIIPKTTGYAPIGTAIIDPKPTYKELP